MDKPPSLKPLPRLIFMSRWLQLPLYLGLIVAQAVYVVHFLIELWHLVENTGTLSETDIMLKVLRLIDVVLIANLLVMVVVGGYETFVSKMGLENHPDEPEWLPHVNASVLKVKLAVAIVIISSVHLLVTFMEVTPDTDQKMLLWQVAIQLSLVVSALAVAYIDRMGAKPDDKPSS
jgi:uncharacterized protein (TIGR00645 family)